MGLRELARRLELSPSAISQIETGRSRPSVSTLYAIVSELGMSLDELFSAGVTEPQVERIAQDDQYSSPAPRPPLLQRGNARKALELGTGVRWERLTAQPDRLVDFLHVVYEVGGSSSLGDSFIRHSGREYGIVLSGSLEVTVGFERYELEAGDSICFDSTVPHVLRNVGTEPARAVWLVVGRDGDHRALEFDDQREGRSGSE